MRTETVDERRRKWKSIRKNGEAWTAVWRNYILCHCGGIRTVSGQCSACGGPPYDLTPLVHRTPSGEEFTVGPAFMGAEGRYEDYELLSLIEQEWKRPPPIQASHFASGMSARAAVVVLYWTYFETRMARLVQRGMADLPDLYRKRINDRSQNITTYMHDTYKQVYGVTYYDDLSSVGSEHIAGHLAQVQDSRNRFIHGEPRAVSDRVVERVVSRLYEEHEAWIDVFNLRLRERRLPLRQR